ncbi:double-strand break repair helicase AddA [Methylovirgula sp. 4M-Z18]|uniref:double-strand break repair helicase AddA n=1 Tax=Methylovirgula sp. 4M-Z18 TaxID=2293567 RepID=UPI000E2E990D|nr:double-strand break repair helicase AddA [Methylovirgula sp. 4M-Z18]RFB79089.1 double-strand break repair helicase AddA [Methylovirgula sp. 4M-Z18]
MSLRPPADTIHKQRTASDPALSAWVSANAGSGKTHVLAQRVIRMLLSGVQPAKILCLTFTKAAAANMAQKVFDTLSRWTMLEDDALRQAILETGAPAPDTNDLAKARRLFARTVETPGGLKIQTIHAFCEKLLHVFPFEANVPASFEVLDDQQNAVLLATARQAVLHRALGDPASLLGQNLNLLVREVSSSSLDTLIGEAMAQRGAITRVIRAYPTQDKLTRALQRELDLQAHETDAAIAQDMLYGGIAQSEWPSLAAEMQPFSNAKESGAVLLARAFAALDDAKKLEIYKSIFLTEKDSPRKNLVAKKLGETRPLIAQVLLAEQDRLVKLVEKLKRAQTVTRTVALLGVLGGILTEYERMKRRQGLFDFQDLIERTLSLLARADAAWVLYKLDAGIDHVLVDEAQDTSPEQWQILQKLTEEFFSGESAQRQARTFFAVGDPKQSIFSFQGADPAMFDAVRRELDKKVREAADPRERRLLFEHVQLVLSFRSATDILEAVDKVFEAPERSRGLSAGDENVRTVHQPLKAKAPGLVEIWPPVGAQARETPRDWRLPVDALDMQDPPVIVARRIAAAIKAMIAPGSPDYVMDKNNQPRAIDPGDVMILVRSRNAFFEAVIRALKAADVPVAGADRLQLTDHIAVMDLIALGRASLLPDDDLTVATVLKSPLVGLDDDDLIALAPSRPGTLLHALQQSADPRHGAAARQLHAWQKQAATLAPFAFYSHVLGADGGRRKLLARLGPEAGDAIDEFLKLTLAEERKQAPALVTFLNGLQQIDLSIKRDMEAQHGAVRVMTVHAAKGLEAKIVFLPDTCSVPGGRHDPKIFFLDDGKGGALPAWSPRTATDTAAVGAVRETARQAQIEEHRRLLYVALTRAEERLYVAGFHGPRGRNAECWFDMIWAGLEPDLQILPAPWDGAEQIYRRQVIAYQKTDVTAAAQAGAVETRLPDWLERDALPEHDAPPPISPSNAATAADRNNGPRAQAVPGRDAAQRGSLMHALLQHLPDVATNRREAAGLRFLQAEAQRLDAGARAALLREALDVLDAPALAALFGPQSRAEVGIAGEIAGALGAKLRVTGRIDRLAVTAEAVFIADYKTGRPRELAETPAAYVSQLALYRAVVGALYPHLPVRAFLIWTTGPQYLEIPEQSLDAALAHVTSAPGAEIGALDGDAAPSYL